MTLTSPTALIAAAIALGTGLGSTASAPADTIDEFVAAQAAASAVPGAAYAVVEDGEITAVGGYGVLELGGDARVTPDTPFASGSISKSITALAVMQLVEAGDIDLDAAISEHLEVFDGGPGADITIRQLLTHTSGYSTLQGNTSHTDTSHTGTADDEEVLERTVDAVAGLNPARAPGAPWEYSNTNYAVLGLVVEVVSGESFADYVTDSILTPIGMENSFVADGQVHPEAATGHPSWFGGKIARSDAPTDLATAPQGGVVASARDLARYLQVMMNGQDDVLSAEGKALMMNASTDSPFYGFGWFVDDAEHTVWHSGSTPGAETLATMMPAQNRAVVVLVNGGSGMGFGDTAALRTGVTALGLDLAVDEDPLWSQKALFVGLALLPLVYAASMVWAWRHRAGLRAKSGAFGLFSLWFPVATTAAAAWVMLVLMPTIIGAPLGTLALFQPDVGLVLVLGAVMGVVWAVFRLALAYIGRTPPNPSEGSAATSPDAARSP